MPIKLLALVLPLSFDTFAVAAALGVAGLDRAERVRLGLIFAGFEAAMPLLGFVAGSAVGSRLGDAGEWAAIAVLGAVGVYMVAVDDDDLAAPERWRGWALVGVGLSVSMDELAIGLAVGLARLPVLLVVVVISAQAFIATQLGTRLGARLGARLREQAERAAGVLLVAFAAVLLVLRLTGHAG